MSRGPDGYRRRDALCFPALHGLKYSWSVTTDHDRPAEPTAPIDRQAALSYLNPSSGSKRERFAPRAESDPPHQVRIPARGIPKAPDIGGNRAGDNHLERPSATTP